MPELETSCHPDGLLELHLDEEARDNNSKNIAEFYIFNFEYCRYEYILYLLLLLLLMVCEEVMKAMW